MISLKLKRALAVTMATVVWSVKDLWEHLVEVVGHGVVFVGGLLIFLAAPVAVFQNFVRAWRLRGVITEKTEWRWSRRKR